jgi:tetratricopeptide (TPR) repeat protein
MFRANENLIDDRYRYIFFVDASTPATIRGDLESAIRSIDGHEQDTYKDALTFMSRTPENGGWLYILDNADDPDIDLTPYFPSCSHGTIIITSRNRRVGVLSNTHNLELGPMQEREAVETLCRAARKVNPLDEVEFSQAIRLVNMLGCLALAIVQAGIYIYEVTPSHGRFTFVQYSSIFEHHRDRLLRKRGVPSVDRYPHGVYATLEISYTRLPEVCREFLHLCSFLRYTSIPISIFSSAAAANFEDTWELQPRSADYRDIQIRLRQIFSKNGQWDELQFHELTQRLNSFSLLSISSIDDTPLLRLHPLVHSHARDKVSKSELPIYKQMAVTCISTSCKGLSPSTWKYVLSHCIALYEECGGEPMHINDVIQFGQLVYRQGEYWRAEKIFRKMAELLVVAQGPGGKDTLEVFTWLASTLWNQGKWNEAEVLDREVLAMRQNTLGFEHPDTIDASANLASTLRKQRKWDESEVLESGVLEIRQRILGFEHPHTIDAWANLASTLRNQRKWNAAEALQREVLAMRQRILGFEHPHTTDASASLASTLRNQGKWNEAKVLDKEVLAIRQRILGLEHPDTILALHNLAATLCDTGRAEEALPLSLQATQLAEKVIGPSHPYTIKYRKRLKICYKSLGRYEEASAV